MKKILLTLCMVFIAIALVYGYAEAITGQCSNCHTMHASQDGTDDPSTAQAQLLKAGCVTCHTGPHGAGGDGRNDSYSAPVVMDTIDPTTQGGSATLAGGDFYWVNAGSDAKGHDVLDLPGISGVDSNIGISPPGWDQGATTGKTLDSKTLQVTGGAGWTTQLSCAGTFGCHGTRDSAGFGGLTGAHHGNASTADQVSSAPTTVANSYRFLGGIFGLEHTNHNWNESASAHNEYYGASDTSAERDDDGTTTYANDDTMSYFCAECHGFFHGKVVASGAAITSPWVRHPTDIVLPASAPFTEYNNDTGGSMGNYNLVAPVARGSIAASSSATVLNNSAAATGGIVMCLSCHRAHGSPEDDLLRFTYSGMTVGSASTTGCFVCHTDKN